MGIIGISSCSQDDYTLLNEVGNQSETSSRAVLKSDSIVTFIADSNLVKKAQGRAFTSYEYDENFHSNMWEIRELQLIIQARGKANTNNTYLSTDGAGKEITLMDYPFTINQRFYLKVLPASSGIPYLIYSQQTNTPLAVGQYNSNPDNKVLFAQPDASGSLYSASWDLIPSSMYKGYFAIQSESYLGQSDPDNMWSVFNYSLEIKDDNKIGYAQYTKKAQQEFLITPANGFKLSHLEFQKDGAIVTKQAPLRTVTYSKNESEERRPFTIRAAHYAYDTSSFSENSTLKVSITNTATKFYRPTVDAEHMVPPSPVKPEDDPSPIRPKADMVYSSANQQIQNKLEFEINGIAAPNSLIEATSYLENYTVSAKYTAHMTYNHNGQERKVKISGVWRGAIYTTIRDNKYPKDIIKFFDLDDGEEIMRTQSITLSPITFK